MRFTRSKVLLVQEDLGSLSKCEPLEKYSSPISCKCIGSLGHLFSRVDRCVIKLGTFETPGHLGVLEKKI